MNQTDPSIWKSTMTTGAFLGLAIIAYQVFYSMLDIEKMSYISFSLLGLIPFFLIIAGIVWGTRNYRDKYQNGSITYLNALYAGTLIVLFASIIGAFYSYIFNSAIDPTFAERTVKISIDKAVQLLQEKGVPEDQIEHQIKLLRGNKIPTPMEGAVSAIFLYTIMGFIVSLVTSAILKKEKPLVTDESSQIPE